MRIMQFRAIVVILVTLIVSVCAADFAYAKNDSNEKGSSKTSSSEKEGEKEGEKEKDVVVTEAASSTLSVTTTSTPIVEVVAEVATPVVVSSPQTSFGYQKVARIAAQVGVVGNATVTRSREVEFVLTAEQATEMAVSFDSNFSNEIMRPFAATHRMLLRPTAGSVQTVYFTFADSAGATSDVIAYEITYAPEVPVALVAPTPTLNTVPLPAAPPVQIAAKRVMLCPERPNTTVLGGTVVRKFGTTKKYLMLDDQQVLCPLEGVVAETWGNPKVKAIRKLPAYRVSTVVPYRPGSIIRSHTNSAILYVVLVTGQLQQLTTSDMRELRGKKITTFRHSPQMIALFQKTPQRLALE